MKNKSKNLDKQNKDNDLSENKKNTTSKKQEKDNLKNLEEPNKESESNSNKLLEGVTYNNFRKINIKEKDKYIKEGKCEMNLLYSDNDIIKKLNYIKNI